MTTNPIRTPDDDDGPVNPPRDPRQTGGPATPPRPADPADPSIHSTGEPAPDEPGAAVPRVVDDVYDPRTRTGRTTLPGLDPPT